MSETTSSSNDDKPRVQIWHEVDDAGEISVHVESFGLLSRDDELQLADAYINCINQVHRCINGGDADLLEVKSVHWNKYQPQETA